LAYFVFQDLLADPGQIGVILALSYLKYIFLTIKEKRFAKRVTRRLLKSSAAVSAEKS